MLNCLICIASFTPFAIEVPSGYHIARVFAYENGAIIEARNASKLDFFKIIKSNGSFKMVPQGKSPENLIGVTILGRLVTYSESLTYIKLENGGPAKQPMQRLPLNMIKGGVICGITGSKAFLRALDGEFLGALKIDHFRGGLGVFEGGRVAVTANGNRIWVHDLQSETQREVKIARDALFGYHFGDIEFISSKRVLMFLNKDTDTGGDSVWSNAADKQSKDPIVTVALSDVNLEDGMWKNLFSMKVLFTQAQTISMWERLGYVSFLEMCSRGRIDDSVSRARRQIVSAGLELSNVDTVRLARFETR